MTSNIFFVFKILPTEEATDDGLPGFEFFIDGFDEDRSVVYHPQEDLATQATVTKITPGTILFTV